jgi:hypothetical protein
MAPQPRIEANKVAPNRKRPLTTTAWGVEAELKARCARFGLAFNEPADGETIAQVAACRKRVMQECDREEKIQERCVACGATYIGGHDTETSEDITRRRAATNTRCRRREANKPRLLHAAGDQGGAASLGAIAGQLLARATTLAAQAAVGSQLLSPAASSPVAGSTVTSEMAVHTAQRCKHDLKRLRDSCEEEVAAELADPCSQCIAAYGALPVDESPTGTEARCEALRKLRAGEEPTRGATVPEPPEVAQGPTASSIPQASPARVASRAPLAGLSPATPGLSFECPLLLDASAIVAQPSESEIEDLD